MTSAFQKKVVPLLSKNSETTFGCMVLRQTLFFALDISIIVMPWLRSSKPLCQSVVSSDGKSILPLSFSCHSKENQRFYSPGPSLASPTSCSPHVFPFINLFTFLLSQPVTTFPLTTSSDLQDKVSLPLPPFLARVVPLLPLVTLPQIHHHHLAQIHQAVPGLCT